MLNNYYMVQVIIDQVLAPNCPVSLSETFTHVGDSVLISATNDNVVLGPSKVADGVSVDLSGPSRARRLSVLSAPIFEG